MNPQFGATLPVYSLVTDYLNEKTKGQYGPVTLVCGLAACTGDAVLAASGVLRDGKLVAKPKQRIFDPRIDACLFGSKPQGSVSGCLIHSVFGMMTEHMPFLSLSADYAPQIPDVKGEAKRKERPTLGAMLHPLHVAVWRLAPAYIKEPPRSLKEIQQESLSLDQSLQMTADLRPGIQMVAQTSSDKDPLTVAWVACGLATLMGISIARDKLIPNDLAADRRLAQRLAFQHIYTIATTVPLNPQREPPPQTAARRRLPDGPMQ